MKIICTSGFFDPIHSGHIECMKQARELGDKLIVIVNNDQQAIAKKGIVIMPVEQRIQIIRELPYVDAVFVAVDEDGTVSKTLECVRPHVFAKGGDRNIGNIPEKEVCDRLGIQIVDGLGDKTFSSRNVMRSIIENIDKVPQSYLNGS